METTMENNIEPVTGVCRVDTEILHDPKDPKLWGFLYSSILGSCRVLNINNVGVVFSHYTVWNLVFQGQG